MKWKNSKYLVTFQYWELMMKVRHHIVTTFHYSKLTPDNFAVLIILYSSFCVSLIRHCFGICWKDCRSHSRSFVWRHQGAPCPLRLASSAVCQNAGATMGVCPAPCAHLRGLQLAATTPHLTGFQRGTTWLPAEIASSYSGVGPQSR